MKWPLYLLAAMIMISSASAATCTLAIFRTPPNYHPGETITFDTICSGVSSGNGMIDIRNSASAPVANVTLSVSSNTHIFTTWTIPNSIGTNLNMRANMTVGGTTSNNVYFNITGLATNQLAITNSTKLYGGAWYWDEINAISAKVLDYNLQPATGAICTLQFLSADNPTEAYWQQGTTMVASDGQVIFNVYVDYNIFDIAQYLYKISCQTNTATSLTNTTLYSASGIGYDEMYVNEYVTDVSAFTLSNKTSFYTQDKESGCVQFTNNYRDYTMYYNIRYKLLCDVGTQDVTVLDGTGREFLDAYQTASYCLPITVPEAAAIGTGRCKLQIGVSPEGAKDDMSSDFYAVSDLFNVSSIYFTLVDDWVKMNATSWQAAVTYTKSLPTEVYADVPARVLDASNNQDLFDTAYLQFSNGSKYYTALRIADVEQGDTANPTGRRFRLEWNTTSTPLQVGQSYTLVIQTRSPMSFYDTILALFSRLVLAIERAAGISPSQIGNYTQSQGSLLSYNTSGLNFQYNFTSIGANTRRNLHFIYEIAPLAGSTEGGFIDQNPYIEGYQAAGRFQALTLNQSKSFQVTYKPSLPSAGSYRVFESVYEYQGVSPVSEQGSSTETLIKQATYDFTSTQASTPDFDGAEIRIDGYAMTSVTQ